ncbi:MAG: winged helix-turn-helix transcriptional regulator [Candidatus Woesearchaeota archaeon]|nr:MAG: winged helix-turn-helix transcriptional regulator [Candidatus Woesearchaeota archaeon]
MLKFLDENERKVLKVIKDEEGISQSSLRFRTNLSKATVSQILSSFEKKGIVKREVEGKTYSVYLTSKI